MTTAEIIAIGDELTSGVRLDTNSQWLSQRLGELGVETKFHTTVGDDLEANINAFNVAASRVDIIICTGGLGPTADDLTRQAIAAAFDRELITDDAVLAHIRSLFERRGREMAPQNAVQAQFPGGARVIPNPHGSAPGIDFDTPPGDGSSARIFALPGVPAEMREMWDQTVFPAIVAMPGVEKKIIRHRLIKCFGVGESDLERMLPDLVRRGRHPSVGITVSRATITLRVTAAAADEAGCHALIQPTVDTIYDCLGDLIFGEGEDQLEHCVAQLVQQRGLTLLTVECGSGGQAGNWLSGLQSPWFAGGIVLPTPASVARSIDHRGPLDLLPTGPQLVHTLAEAYASRFDADLVLVASPPVGLDGRTDDQSKVHLAIKHASGVETISQRSGGHPDIVRDRTAKQALDFLRLHLLKGDNGKAPAG